MSVRQIHDFGRVDERGDAFEFVIDPANGGACVLVAVVQTERGPRRTEIGRVPSAIWGDVASAAVKELSAEMGDDERAEEAPTLRAGLNRFSPLVGRELGVLVLALMEEGAAAHIDALLHAWRELAREERWWLYSKAAAPGQRAGTGWRRALFHALSETWRTKDSAPADEAQKKLWEHSEAAIAESRAERYLPRTPSSDATPEPVPSPPAQESTKSPRGKGKGKKKPVEDDPQIDLFRHDP